MLERKLQWPLETDRPRPARPLLASISLPCTRARRTRVITRTTPGFRQAAFPTSCLPGPTCVAVTPAGDGSAPGTPAMHRAACCARDCGAGGRGRRWQTGRGPSRGGEAPSSLPGPPLPLQPRPLARPHARAAPRGSQTAGLRKFCFSLARNQEGEVRWSRVSWDRRTGRFPRHWE